MEVLNLPSDTLLIIMMFFYDDFETDSFYFNSPKCLEYQVMYRRYTIMEDYLQNLEYYYEYKKVELSLNAKYYANRRLTVFIPHYINNNLRLKHNEYKKDLIKGMRNYKLFGKLLEEEL